MKRYSFYIVNSMFDDYKNVRYSYTHKHKKTKQHKTQL